MNPLHRIEVSRTTGPMMILGFIAWKVVIEFGLMCFLGQSMGSFFGALSYFIVSPAICLTLVVVGAGLATGEWEDRVTQLSLLIGAGGVVCVQFIFFTPWVMERWWGTLDKVWNVMGG